MNGGVSPHSAPKSGICLSVRKNMTALYGLNCRCRTCLSANARRSCSSCTSAHCSAPASPCTIVPPVATSSPVVTAAAFAAATQDARKGDTPNAAGLFPRRSEALTAASLLCRDARHLELVAVGDLELLGPERASKLAVRVLDGAGAVDGRLGYSSRAAAIAWISAWKDMPLSSPAPNKTLTITCHITPCQVFSWRGDNGAASCDRSKTQEGKQKTVT